ncbi:MAG: DUF1631 family protein [Burkholderiales bacterium]|nr:DUF1631 family protein [Burkholderiales bacterium]
MISNRNEQIRYANTVPVARRKEILHSLIPIASCAANSQIDAFSLNLANAMLAKSENSGDALQARLYFTGAELLKKNAYVFYYLASAKLEEAMREAMRATEKRSVLDAIDKCEQALALVSYDEMDNKVLLSNMARPFELKYSEQYQTLGIRLASLTDQDELSLANNPFRPDVFLTAMNDAWTEFNPDVDAHPLVLPLMQQEVFFDMGPILHSVNESLISHGILPSMSDAYRIKKTTDAGAAKPDANVNEELRRMLGYGEEAGQAGSPGQMLQIGAVGNQLLGFLAGMQKTLLDQQLAGMTAASALSTEVLANIKRQAPQGALTRVDENTIDLLTKVFDTMFSDQNIETEMKGLMGVLQVPVLKAALLDKEFFFQREHPARRLVDMLTKLSIAWDKSKGEDDPLYQTVKRIVDRIQTEFDRELSVFSDVMNDLESFAKEEEKITEQTLSTPIAGALKKEKYTQAQKVAKNEVAMRIGTGEVVAFVETFLENKWVNVLTIAYTMQDEKPQAVESAVSTMDDLVWSVKPKITMEDRKELIGKLPSILQRLNKWLNVVKWDEAERVKFFADLAETHASIVRAPLPMTPERRLEIAVEVAKKAAERRLQKLANAKPEPEADEFDEKIKSLERGAWFNFFSDDFNAIKRAKLSWVSPMKSLFIFTSHNKEDTFQLTDKDLAQRMRKNTAQQVMAEGLVDRALTQAFGAGANDPAMEHKAAA